MCISLGGGNPHLNQPEKVNNANNNNSANNKSNENVDKTESHKGIESDSVEVENNYKESGHAATSISFDNTETKSTSNQPINQTEINDDPEMMKIAEFISSMNDKTMQAILDAFDRMLEASRRMMEENKIFFKKVTQPKQEALKKVIMQDDLNQREIARQIQNKNI